MKRKKRRKACAWTGLILGVIFLSGTLRHTARETAVREDILCTAAAHSHEPGCYQEGRLCCGYGDVLLHTHEECCYHAGGNLRCTLPQILPHVHTNSCYGPAELSLGDGLLWTQVLICDIPEVQLHIHGEGCFDNGRWICGQLQIPEHKHSPDCFQTLPERGRFPDLGEAKLSPFTIAGLLHAAAAAGLLYLQKKWEKIGMETAKILPR